MTFEHKVVWITGASSGIGESLAIAFDRLGARLILTSRRKEELERVKNTLQNESRVLVADISNIEAMDHVVNHAISFFGHVDILINNAGISQRGRVEETSIVVDQRIFAVNFFGNIALTKALLPHMIARTLGHIVTISSVAGKISTPGRSSYAASKHALHGWYEALRAEVADRNIQITLICPGYIRTNVSINALDENGDKHGVMDPNQQKGMDPDICAKHIIRAIHNKKKEAYIGKQKYFVALRTFFPGLYYHITRRMAAKESNQRFLPSAY